MININRLAHLNCWRFTALLCCVMAAPCSLSQGNSVNPPPATVPESEELLHFVDLLISPPSKAKQTIKYFRDNWKTAYLSPLLELLTINRQPEIGSQIVALFEEKTGQHYGYDIQKWFSWVWQQDYQDIDYYPEFKSWLYGNLDPKFEQYFSSDYATRIRLDEVRWGGVRQDGIPPLRDPLMISAAQADYLDDSNVIFALEVNGDYRAYPKRILAWHEMFVDTIGGVDVVGVYCTLCGSMILYETKLAGVNHEMGTSGFLYRSNKLMYDQSTQSLWSTLLGKPVIGALVGKGIKLKLRSVITTTWGEWRRRHPQTKVLSLNTGHRRNYGEGVAYHDYFATDKLMFNVPKLDRRLKNKDEILGLVLAEHANKPLAISANYLLDHPLFHHKIDDFDFVVVTDNSGANRVYATKGLRFTRWDSNDTLVDEQNQSWRLTESHLIADDGTKLFRLPAHRAFWFGWFSAYSHTKLITQGLQY